jgi:hypothetical protein
VRAGHFESRGIVSLSGALVAPGPPFAMIHLEDPDAEDLCGGDPAPSTLPPQETPKGSPHGFVASLANWPTPCPGFPEVNFTKVGVIRVAASMHRNRHWGYVYVERRKLQLQLQ